MTSQEPTEVIEKRAFDAARMVLAPSVADGQEEALDTAAGAVAFHVASTFLYGAPGRVFSLAADVEERLTWLRERPSFLPHVKAMGFTAAEVDSAVTAAARALVKHQSSPPADRVEDIAEAQTAALAEHMQRPDAGRDVPMKTTFGCRYDADGHGVAVHTDHGRVVVAGDAAFTPKGVDELLALIDQARAVAFLQAAELATWEEPVA